MDCLVNKLQACISVLIEFAPSKWQKNFQIKCHNISHLQMNIFSIFYIFDRRNALVAGMDRSKLYNCNKRFNFTGSLKKIAKYMMRKSLKMKPQ